MTKKKRNASDSANPASPSRRKGPREGDEIVDRSPATGITVSTSEEVLAMAHDTADRGRPRPTYDEIAAAAYQRYLERGATDGQDQDDWLAAERELSERR